MMRAVEEKRLDQWLVAHGYAVTRDDARAAIMAGDVTVDGVVIDKPGRRMRPGSQVAVRRRPEHPFVGRGGLKLAHALAVFAIDARGRTAVDLGASTGGFTDCLLQAGAARVYAVDVGRGQLAWRLRTDPRVVCLEGVNARYLTPEQVGGPCDLVTADLAFISLRLVWRAIAAIVRPDGDVVALIKPQFEAGRDQVGRRGVVRDPAVHEAVLRGTLAEAAASGLVPLAVTASPLVGPAGNIEYLVHLRGTRSELAAPAPPPSLDLAGVVADAHARFPAAGGVADLAHSRRGVSPRREPGMPAGSGPESRQTEPPQPSSRGRRTRP
jgi:23S rRNA (cytidine1920-2'-O)/16S rRNA (cytidine1409-2'-O)-methyltransferase